MRQVAIGESVGSSRYLGGRSREKIASAGSTREKIASVGSTRRIWFEYHRGSNKILRGIGGDPGPGAKAGGTSRENRRGYDSQMREAKNLTRPMISIREIETDSKINLEPLNSRSL